MRGEESAVAAGAMAEEDEVVGVDGAPTEGLVSRECLDTPHCVHDVVAAPGPAAALVVAAPILDLDDSEAELCESRGEGFDGCVVESEAILPEAAVDDDEGPEGPTQGWSGGEMESHELRGMDAVGGDEGLHPFWEEELFAPAQRSVL